MPLLVCVRHGQSEWNLQNRFTGDVDVELTDQGRAEALQAGKNLTGIIFNYGFTSLLKRANETLEIILNEIHQETIPVIKDMALNERNYGSLQGLNKADMAKKYGTEQVEIWRRSFDIRPPGGESLADTAARVIPYYQKEIAPLLRKGANVLIVAHGNSLRALMMGVEGLSKEEIEKMNLPTGQPRIYHLDGNLKILNITVAS
ncbi:MAG: 2,3-bisphosphoglycerate-dependent phosphoglycerate mutase [Bacteroidetes bacterium]|nr:2,3-bisphosphoglycerate-dependent phosphoglycerate mutase [Bacteroidota bacterium]